MLELEGKCALYRVYAIALSANVDALFCRSVIIDVGIPYDFSLVTMGIVKFCITMNLLSNEVLTW
jgi:hypothetical protein